MTKKERRRRIKMLEKNTVINRDNYNTNKITREQYYINKQAVSSRITELKREI